MFDRMIEHAKEELKQSSQSYDLNDVIDLTVEYLVGSMKESEHNYVENLISEHDAFVSRNRNRWKDGFQKLHSLRQISLEAGIEFRKQFLLIPDYHTDPLLGVLMMHHANACRISGEIIHLLEGGYPDAALARWRTLYEISVTCLVIQKYGKDAAIDYINHGRLKAVEGMEEYQKTAKEMGVEPYSSEEMYIAKNLKEEITKGENHFHWAKKYTGFSKFEKLREHVGLGKWSNIYKLASRNVHADYTDMLSLNAMSETKEKVLLTGQSSSGMTGPAHYTAIALSQITTAYLTAYIHDETRLDYTNSLIFIKLINSYVDEVGSAFLSVQGDQ